MTHGQRRGPAWPSLEQPDLRHVSEKSGLFMSSTATAHWLKCVYFFLTSPTVDPDRVTGQMLSQFPPQSSALCLRYFWTPLGWLMCNHKAGQSSHILMSSRCWWQEWALPPAGNLGMEQCPCRRAENVPFPEPMIFGQQGPEAGPRVSVSQKPGKGWFFKFPIQLWLIFEPAAWSSYHHLSPDVGQVASSLQNSVFSSAKWE